MHVFRRIVLSSAIAGCLVGLIVTLVQQIGTAPLILKSEVYERAAELSHSPTVGSADAHNHDGSADHEHSEAIWAPAEGMERTAYSAAANVLTAVGFALLLCGLYALRGDEATWRTGLLWGFAGFIVFVAAPTLSLPPELPGMTAGAAASPMPRKHHARYSGPQYRCLPNFAKRRSLYRPAGRERARHWYPGRGLGQSLRVRCDIARAKRRGKTRR